MTTQSPNAFCVVHGTQGQPGFFIEGPFTTEEEAAQNATQDSTSHPDVPTAVETLVNPANC